MKQVLCYGDSNTWGHNPQTQLRHEKNVRWPGVLAELLGSDYNVVECGISGRTTVFDDPFYDCRNGRKGLGYALQTHMPIDVLIINLGTNDLKFTTSDGAARGISILLHEAIHASIPNRTAPVLVPGAMILVISPILLAADIEQKRPGVMPAGSYEESTRFAPLYWDVCQQYGVEFLDAAEYAEPSPTDCIHMEADSHKRLAYAVYEKLQSMMKEW